MKQRSYIMGALLLLAATLTAGGAYAQRGHMSLGIGAHFYGGGGRVAFGGRVGAPVYYAPHYYRPVRVYHPYVGAYYPYYRYPVGFRLGILPYGFMTFGTPWGPYFYFDGTFYRHPGNSDSGYEVAEPPVGADVPSLPAGAKQVTIDGNAYYEYNGTIYQEVIKHNERRYAIVGKNGQLNLGGDDNDNNSNNAAPDNQAAQPDDVLSQLPGGSHKVEINGQQLYVSPDGMYYQEVQLDNNMTGYKVVGKQTAD